MRLDQPHLRNILKAIKQHIQSSRAYWHPHLHYLDFIFMRFGFRLSTCTPLRRRRKTPQRQTKYEACELSLSVTFPHLHAKPMRCGDAIEVAKPVLEDSSQLLIVFLKALYTILDSPYNTPYYDLWLSEITFQITCHNVRRMERQLLFIPLRCRLYG